MTRRYRPRGMSLEDSFRWYVPEPCGDGCVEWPGPIHKEGYGMLKSYGVNHRAHVVSYTIHVGEVPPGLCVLHDPVTCNNRRCVNPFHLRAGTNAENAADRHIAGTEVYGERKWSAKLTADDVLQIRSEYATGLITYQELADRYGVGTTIIGSIIQRQKWTHV